MITAQLKTDYKRILGSPKIYLSVLGIILLCVLSTKRYIHGQEDIFYVLDILIGLSVFKKLIVIFAAIPCVMGFYEDWKHQYIRNIVLRTGKKHYVLSKIIVCVTISFFVVFIGITLFLGGLMILGVDYSGVCNVGALVIALQNIRKWRTNARIWILLILTTTFVHSYTKEISTYAQYIGMKSSPWIYPFLYTDRYIKNSLFSAADLHVL